MEGQRQRLAGGGDGVGVGGGVEGAGLAADEAAGLERVEVGLHGVAVGLGGQASVGVGCERVYAQVALRAALGEDFEDGGGDGLIHVSRPFC